MPAKKKTAAKRKVAKKKTAAKSAAPDNVVPMGGVNPPSPTADTGPMSFPLNELYVYKLQLLNKQLEEAKTAIAQPLKAAYEQELMKRVNAALEADPNCKAAFNQRVACINDILDAMSDSLPAGYAVSAIHPEKAEVTAVFDPEHAAQRLELKE